MHTSLKTIPITYRGELHDVRLINFSVALDEVMPFVPAGITPRNFNNRAMISMVNVNLKKMHPHFAPACLNFAYRHIGFRLLINDGAFNNGKHKGIYFLKSFTDKPWIVWGGKLFTNYNLETAYIAWTSQHFKLQQVDKFLQYTISSEEANLLPNLKATIGSIDRAYLVEKGNLRMIQIQREKWPLQEIAISDFKTNFFTSARQEGAFRVPETIFYQWLPSKRVQQCAL